MNKTVRTGLVIVGVVTAAMLVFAVLVINSQLRKSKQASTQTYWPTQGWRTSTPEEQGFDSGKLADGLQTLKDKRVAIDSLLIVRNGYLVLDAYFYPYESSLPHNLASVTKSVTTSLIGIAIDQGKLQLDQPMLSFFPDRTIANVDARKEHITIKHLVSMRNGYSSGCLSGDVPTLDTMSSHPDWVQASLDRQMAQEPGKVWCYDSPGMHLLSAILQKATGMTELEFARQALFGPLGIGEVFWEDDPQGLTHGWGDLYLKPPDAAKFGYLWLNNGVWEGKQLVPQDWIKASVQPLSDAGEDKYGYGWWVADDSYFAAGRLGQYIRIYPAYNAVVVVTAHGLDYEQIEPLLSDSFVSPNEALPNNPAGADRLKRTLAALAQPTDTPVSSPISETAAAISGKTYRFETNPLNLASLRLEFNGSNEAALHMNVENQDETWPIGLDGKYRIASDGVGVRGYWADPQTFVLQVFEVGLTTYRLHFDGEGVEITSPDRAVKINGQVQQP